MKYSKRELKAFNIFALLLFGIGGFFLIFGAIEYAFQPTTSYPIARQYRKAVSAAQPSTESVESSVDEPIALPAHVQRGVTVQETVIEEGTNFKAVSRAFLGFVFLVLSFGLNFVLLRVMRRGGQDARRAAQSD